MNNPHIEDLTIENFKCFKHLEVNNIGRVNLIGGKNNVGKTAFLEAVELFFNSEKAYDIYFSICNLLERRQKQRDEFLFEIDFFYNDKLEIAISSSVSYSKYCKINRSIIPVTFSESLDLYVNDDKMGTALNTYYTNKQQKHPDKNKKNVNYIGSSTTSENIIAIFFGTLIELGMEVFLSHSLNLFDNNIIALKQIVTQQGVTLKLKLKDREKLVLLSSLGEGINRYIAILCAIWASKDSVLLIDEIENGIHYTNYKKLWQIIFQASIDANCQLFITTHSKECISAFNEVQFENQQCNAQYFEFYKNLKTDLITAADIDKDELLYCLTNNRGIRGE